MAPIKRILCATDFSDLAASALACAVDLARRYGSQLHVLHVASPARELPIAGDAGLGMVDVGAMLVVESIQDIIAERQHRLQMLVDGLQPLPSAPVAVVRSGSAWEVIARYVEELAIDMVVIGSHARGMMQRVLLGSTSKSVLEHVACPVLMVPIAATTRRECAHP